MCTRLLENVDYVILGDKIGDIYAYDLPLLKKRKFLVGHCATVITDVKFVGDYLATSDRDEKVFVCHFPQTFNIQSICVGHKQYVSCIGNVDERLVSGSADGLIRLWNHETGHCDYQWYLDELLSEEGSTLIPTAILTLSDDYSFSSHISLNKPVVALTSDRDVVKAMTNDLKFFTISLNGTIISATEIDSTISDTLNAVDYVFEEVKDDEESGEMLKRSVKNRWTSSQGLEKQFEHDQKRKLVMTKNELF